MASTHTDPGSPPDWRTRKAQGEIAPKHRWQTSQSERGPARMPGPSRRRNVILTVLMLAALGLIGWYVRSLLIAPEQTPILVITAGPYPEPFGPNAFAAEDADGIEQLHGQTARVARARNLQNFDKLLKSLIDNQKGAKTIVIVLSMHGGVNEQSEPCLIPHGASPRNTATWIPFSEVLSRIAESGIPASTHKLLVLDCNRIRMRWRQGTLFNAFTNRLIATKVVEDSKIANLTVLNSVSPGQRGWASAELNASVFGHYLNRGLAGEADKPAESGNGDRSVSLQELKRYVTHHVDHWVHHHRGERQQPVLLQSSGTSDDDFHVVWAMRGDPPATTPTPSAVTDEQIDALWDRHDRLSRSGHESSDPRRWGKFRRMLLRLDEIAVAGKAYETQTRALYGSLKALATELENSDATSWAWLNTQNGDTANRTSLRVHSLRLAELIKSLKPEELQGAKAAMQLFEQDPNANTLREAVNALSAIRGAGEFESVALLKMLQKHEAMPLWKSGALPGRVVRNRARSTRLSVPSDPRVFGWLRSQLETANAGQRVFEDRLFAGESNRPAGFDKQVAAATTAYDEIATRSNDMSAAYALHDRAWAEIPWLAAWLSKPGTLMREKLRNESIAERLSALVAAAHQFHAVLRKQESHGVAMNRVREALEELSQLYDGECGDLGRLESDAGVVDLRRIESALSIPLVPGHQGRKLAAGPSGLRRKLRQLRRKIAENLHSQYRETAWSAADGSDIETQTSRLQDVRAALERFAARWKVHPAVALLQDGGAAEERNRDAEDVVVKVIKSEHALRSLLDAYPRNLKAAIAANAGDAKAYRARLSRVARTVRAAGAVPLPDAEPDPVRHLQRFDIHNLLLWQANRGLDDFWAGSEPAAKPYFERTARDYVNGAAIVFQAMPRTTSAKIDRRIADLQLAAARGLRVSTGSDVQLAADEPLVVTAKVTADESLKSVARSQSAVPVFLVTGKKGRVANAVAPVNVGSATDSLRLSLPMADVQAAGTPLNAVVLFRGHEFRESLVANRSGGVVIEWKPQTFGDARITLSGDLRKPVSIVFVLDCSQSMARKVGGGTKSRMDVAKEALVAMLDQLAKRGNARVGVLFYGHRVGWEADEGKEILRRKNYARKIPAGMLPLEDVETVLSLGRFNARIGAGIERLLKTLQPWGETPLYLSLTEALGQFSGEPAGAEKRIIVITDGLNNQRVPAELTLTKSQQSKVTSLTDVTTALNSQKVPMFLLGFEMSGEETRAATGDFRSIATSSGGRFLSAVNAKTLLPSLKSLFGPDRFNVNDATGTEIKGSSLGKSVAVSPTSLKDGMASVSAGSAAMRVRLEGGENLQLRLSSDGRSITTEPYLVGSPKFVALVDSNSKQATGVKAGVHAPTRAAGGGTAVMFAVSLQKDDGSVADRPAAYWIEVTPMNEKREAVGSIYPFFDRRFDIGSPTPPVPVMQLQADGWPKAATHAGVQVYTLTKPVEPAKRIALKPLLASGESSFGGARIRADVADINGRTRLRVVQRTANQSTALTPVKIDLGGMNSPVMRIIRRFDTGNGVAVHEFFFTGDRKPALQNAELRLTPRGLFTNNGSRAQSTVVIGVPSQGAVLRLTPPAP